MGNPEQRAVIESLVYSESNRPITMQICLEIRPRFLIKRDLKPVQSLYHFLFPRRLENSLRIDKCRGGTASETLSLYRDNSIEYYIPKTYPRIDLIYRVDSIHARALGHDNCSLLPSFLWNTVFPNKFLAVSSICLNDLDSVYLDIRSPMNHESISKYCT